MSGAGPSLYPGEFPKWAVFRFPPDAAPPAIPPPVADAPFTSFRNPFPIPANIYNAVLQPIVPLTVAAVYATTISLLNAYNRKHGNKPWAISKTRAFYIFVIFHNVFLAVYSAVTCWAMIRSLKHAIPHYTEPNALVGTVDALCKIHGPRGLGDAVTYNSETQQWQSTNRNIQLDPNGLPQSDDLGRVWNEGLAFWGWIFYLSKFYEVIDTLIIIFKGKRSTTLQTYHHAGAMLSMWSGIRYMSPPIWMFALVNSGIHAMMYTYYTVSALGVRVPQGIKRTLTTMQITQFLVGVTFAALHLFVSYTVPVSVAYEVAENVLPKLNASSIASAASSVASTAVPAATGAGLAFLKKWIYRAAGDEGLAENVYAAPATTPAAFAGAPQHAQHPIQHATHTRTVYRTQYEHVPCIDTSGQAFAIYLNLIYLAPLTILFMRFFVKSYMRRGAPNTKHRTTQQHIAKSTRDAIHGVDREIESLGKSAEDGVDAFVNGRGRPAANGEKKSAKPNGEQRNGNGTLSPENRKFVDSLNMKVSQELERIGEDDVGSRERARKLAKEAVGGTPKKERGFSPEGDQTAILGRPNAE
ncbi:hypothetical protein DPSP01_004649 [Paraphaeosphaeria sporulosa]|uniref:Elongation of fatty acids protein n=1 Tax=Paraphaeosphaeria sporulosa TaxID=1460663 RepID=A0A177C8G9_9PLEO|nr:uncharacterized protein CC84DRAFT_1177951 [Paraphaeosphaeria sporulosa]OAG04044.1 hypothetical protein CC84DRAFT_1177951 [Paraphaeosphaeria sporulosa]